MSGSDLSRRLLAALAAGLVLCVTSACTAGVNSNDPAATLTPSSQPSTNPRLPAGGVWLSNYGFQNGPAGFSLPEGLAISERIDQANVVTLIVDAAQAELLAGYLDRNLSAMGFEIVARALNLGTPTSLIFEAPGWHGAFTLGQQQAGLTLRRGQGSFNQPS